MSGGGRSVGVWCALVIVEKTLQNQFMLTNFHTIHMWPNYKQKECTQLLVERSSNHEEFTRH